MRSRLQCGVSATGPVAVCAFKGTHAKVRDLVEEWRIHDEPTTPGFLRLEGFTRMLDNDKRNHIFDPAHTQVHQEPWTNAH